MEERKSYVYAHTRQTCTHAKRISPQYYKSRAKGETTILYLIHNRCAVRHQPSKPFPLDPALMRHTTHSYKQQRKWKKTSNICNDDDHHSDIFMCFCSSFSSLAQPKACILTFCVYFFIFEFRTALANLFYYYKYICTRSNMNSFFTYPPNTHINFSAYANSFVPYNCTHHFVRMLI